MNFQAAFDKAFDVENERSIALGKGKFQVSKDTARISAFIWNIISAADGKFDDFAGLSENLDIVSIPKAKTKTVAKGSGDGGPENP